MAGSILAGAKLAPRRRVGGRLANRARSWLNAALARQFGVSGMLDVSGDEVGEEIAQPRT